MSPGCQSLYFDLLKQKEDYHLPAVSCLLPTTQQMDGPKRRTAEDALWGLRQAGWRLERYVEDFIEHIDFALAHLLLRTSTFRPNGSDRLPKRKTPLILRSSTCVLSLVPPSAAKWSPRFAGKSRPLFAANASQPPFAANASHKPAADRGQRKPPASRKSRPTQAASQPPIAADASRQPATDRGRRKPPAIPPFTGVHAAVRGSAIPPFAGVHAAVRGLPRPAVHRRSRRRSRLPQARRSREITPPFAAHPGLPFTGDHAAVSGLRKPAGASPRVAGYGSTP